MFSCLKYISKLKSFLFEIKIPPLQTQKHNRELEVIVQECILNTIRESIPVEAILKAYMDETVEEDVTEEIKEEYIDEVPKDGGTVTQAQEQNVNIDSNSNRNNSQNQESKIRFNDTDYVRDTNNVESSVNSPKSIEHLELLNKQRAELRSLDDDDDDEGNVRLNISNQSVSLSDFDVQVMDEPKLELLPDLLIDDIEVLS